VKRPTEIPVPDNEEPSIAEILQVSDQQIRKFFVELEQEQSRRAAPVHRFNERLDQCQSEGPNVKYRTTSKQEGVMI